LPVTFFLHPVRDPAVLVAGFLLFRLFDILKPPPVRQFEKLPAGWGIMADDLAAGVYANLSLWLVTYLGLFTSIANMRS
jgi:phosphatidylglycerophosphatase A